MSYWKNTPEGQGILVATDEKIEWLLPWWWNRYSTSNRLPVAFVDLGMSHYGKTFCEQRGKVIPLEMEPIAFNEASTEWKAIFGKAVKESRQGWFKKPFALLATPFEKTLWLDLDCEVLRPLDDLFELQRLSLVQENVREEERRLHLLEENENLYNSGVILYSHGEQLIEKWAEAHLKEHEKFVSDQHVLSHLIHIHAATVHSLDEDYNWRISQGLNVNAAIVHWVGGWGKEYIRRYGGIAEELDALPKI